MSDNIDKLYKNVQDKKFIHFSVMLLTIVERRELKLFLINCFLKICNKYVRQFSVGAQRTGEFMNK